MKVLTIFFFYFSISYGTYAQNVEKQTAEIKAVLTDFFEVFTHPDLKYYDRNCSSDFQLLEHGEVWTRKEIKEYVEKMTSKPIQFERTNSFEFTQVNFRGKMAWVNYHNAATIKSLSDGSVKKLQWLESIILEKVNGKWILHQMHSTRKSK